MKKSICTFEELKRAGLVAGDEVHFATKDGRIDGIVNFLYATEDEVGIVLTDGEGRKVHWLNIIEFWPQKDSRREFVV